MDVSKACGVTEVLVMGFKALHRSHNIAGFGMRMDETRQSAHACGQEIDIIKNVTYLGIALCSTMAGSSGSLWWVGLARCCGLPQDEYMVLPIHRRT